MKIIKMALVGCAYDCTIQISYSSNLQFEVVFFGCEPTSAVMILAWTLSYTNCLIQAV